MTLQFINRLNSFHKLWISLLAGVVGYFILPFEHLAALLHLIFGWDIFCIFLLGLTWPTFYMVPPSQIKKEAELQDDKSVIIFFIVLIASSVSLLGVIMLSIAPSDHHKAFHLIVTVACMVLSWTVIHTIFATRYAHLYYADYGPQKEQNPGGLNFPGKDKPDFVDFAYFSFTLGMTFQVSDVEISGRKIRRLALWHGLLSFGYNATIIALTVNIVAGLT